MRTLRRAIPPLLTPLFGLNDPPRTQDCSEAAAARQQVRTSAAAELAGGFGSTVAGASSSADGDGNGNGNGDGDGDGDAASAATSP
jgi:hypothetical protein